jgi:hypothetical protein
MQEVLDFFENRRQNPEKYVCNRLMPPANRTPSVVLMFKPAIDCNIKKYALSPLSLCMISLNGLFPRFPRNIPFTIPKLQFKNFHSSVFLVSMVTILEVLGTVNEKISQH